MGQRLSKIYTRTGDQGETGLADGRRVSKDHPRVEAMGEVDSLNSQLGLLLAELACEQAAHPGLRELTEVLAPCQHRLFDLGGELAMPDYQAVQAIHIADLEQAIDGWNSELVRWKTLFCRADRAWLRKRTCAAAVPARRNAAVSNSMRWNHCAPTCWLT